MWDYQVSLWSIVAGFWGGAVIYVVGHFFYQYYKFRRMRKEFEKTLLEMVEALEGKLKELQKRLMAEREKRKNDDT